MNTTQAPIDPTIGANDPAEFIAAKRKQEMALALLKQLQGGAPEPEKTRILARKPISNNIMNLLSQSLVRDKVASADKRVGDLTKAQQDAYSAGATELMGATDKNAAIAKALASNDPNLRALGAAQDKARREAEAEAAKRRADLAKAAATLHGDKGDTAGGLRVLNTQEINPNAPIPGAPEPTIEPKVIGGQTIPFTTNTDPKTGKKTGTAGKLGSETRIVLPSDKKESAAAMAIGGDVPKVLRESMENAQKALQTQDSAARILDTLKDPAIITGSFAEPRLLLAKVGDLLGLEGSQDIGKTQGLMSELANQTLAAVRRLPGAITEKERPFLEMAAAGKLDYTPAAMQRLAEIAQVTSQNELMQYVKQYDAAARQPGIGDSANMYPFPKGWRFQPNEETMEPQGAGSDLWRMKPQKVGPAAPAAQKATPYNDLSDEALRQRLEALRGRK